MTPSEAKALIRERRHDVRSARIADDAMREFGDGFLSDSQLVRIGYQIAAYLDFREKLHAENRRNAAKRMAAE